MKSRLLRWSLLGSLLLVCCALRAQLPTASPSAPTASLPVVVARYEGMLAASPAKGTAFDKVYQHFFAGEGLDALAARWQARAADGGPGAESFLLLQGLLAERRARPDEARAFYQQFTVVRPHDPRGWTALGELEAAEGHFTPAADAFTRALAPDAKPPVPAANRPGVYRALARAQARDFLTAASLETWRKLAGEFPDDPGILQEVGEAFQEAQSYDEARTVFEKVRDLARRNGDAFGRVNATLRTGQVEEARGHGPEAITIYEGVVADSKAGGWLEREARARIEGLYRAQEDLPGLADYYCKSLKDHPKNVEAATRLAAVLGELGRRDEAVETLRQAVAWAPERQELAVELARRLGESGHPGEAAAVLEKLTAVAPEEKSYWQLLGDARWQQLEALPADAPGAGRAPLRAGALAAWNHLSPADGKPDPAATGQLADLLAAHHLTDEALAQFARAAAQAPEVPDLYERWAAFLAQAGRKDEARRVAAGIVSGTPKNATPGNYQRLATTLDRLDDPDSALDATARGLALDGRSFDLLSLRWQLLTARKRWAEAVALYPALLAAAPNAYFSEGVQTRHLTALQSAGTLAETRAALARRLGGQPPLDEGELAFLARGGFQASGEEAAVGMDEAKRALAEGLARFPKSVTLARLEGELAKRAHDPAGQVAALRRVIELQPAGKTDLLAEIVRAWRDAGQDDRSLAAGRELVAASPANAASHGLLADGLLAAGRPDEALERLRDAVRLSDRPNDVRLRLARTLTDLGRPDEARRTLDEAFEAAGDARERLALMRPLTDAYQSQGHLDDLVARFQRLQSVDAEGWRYSLYLAEIYQGVNDLPAARQELARALVLRPKDAGLLRQLVRLATQEENHPEAARYQALLAEAEPSDTNQFALVAALLENDQSAEALAALRGHLGAVRRSPGGWNALLPLLVQHELTGQVADLLAAEAGADGADPRARSTMALLQLAAGNEDRARELFWEVFDTRAPRALAAVSPPAAPKGNSPTPEDRNERLARLFYGGASTAEQRLADAARTRQVAQAALTPDGLRGAFASSRGTGLASALGLASAPAASVSLAPPPDPVDTARDEALVYLAALSVRDHTAGEFLATLDGHLARRESTRADRLVAYCLLGFTDSEIRECAAQWRAPEAGLDSFCLARVFNLANENNPQNSRDSFAPPLTPEQTAALSPLFEPLLARLASAQAEIGQESDNFDLLRYEFLVGLRRKEEAARLREAVIDSVNDQSPPDRMETALDLLLMGEISASDRAKLGRICRVLSRTKGRDYSYYPGGVLTQDSTANKLPTGELAEVLADVLMLWYPSALPVAPSQSRRQQASSAALDNEYLPPNHFLDEAVTGGLQGLGGEFLQQETNARLLATCAVLERQVADLPPARRVYPRLFAACLFASGGLTDEALAGSARLLADAPEDQDLRLLHAVLLGKAGRHAEAVTSLKQIDPAATSETPVGVQSLLLREAAAGKDADTGRAVAGRLLSLRLTTDEKEALVSTLRGMELPDEADRLDQASKGGGSNAGLRAGSPLNPQNAARFQELTTRKDEAGVLALAHAVFAALPPPYNPARGDTSGYVVSAAVNALEQVGKREEFGKEIERALAKAPDSLALNYQWAVFLENSNNPAAASISDSAEVETPPVDDGTPSTLWLKLARAGAEMVGSASLNGKQWQEIGRATVGLGAAPVAAVVLGSPERTKGQVDRVALTPVQDGQATGALTAGLPTPWQAVRLPSEQVPEGEPLAAPAWEDGGFVLEDAGGGFGDERDRGVLVWRPLGEGREMVARLPAASIPGSSRQLGLAWREDLSPDSSEVVVFGAGRSAGFVHRDAPDRTARAWRRVIDLRPKEPVYLYALAAHLQNHGGKAEAAKVGLRIIDLDPDEAFGGVNVSSVVNMFPPADLPILVERLLAWNPSKRYGSMDRNPFPLAISAAHLAKRPDLVVALAHRAVLMGKTYPDNNFLDDDTRKFFLEALVQTGQADEARATLLSCYLRPENTASPTSGSPTLGFERPHSGSGLQTARDLFSNVSWQQRGPELPGLEPLGIAAPAGVLPALQSALAQRQSADPQEFAREGTDWLLTFVRIENRDPSVLAGLPARLAGIPGPRGTGLGISTEDWAALSLDLAARLLRWPGHEALVREALHTAGRLMAGGRDSRGLDGAVHAARARGELLLGDPAAALVTTRAYADRINSAPRGRYTEGDYRICLELLARCGPAADGTFAEMYAKWSARDDGKQVAEEFRAANALRTGGWPRFRASAWLLDPATNPDSPDATVVYEVRPDGLPTGVDGRELTAQGRDFSGSSGERVLTILHGPDVGSLQPLCRLTITGTSGTWTGPVPKGRGVLRAVIDVPRAVDAAALASPDAEQRFPVSEPYPLSAPDVTQPDRDTLVARAPNLLVNPGFDGVPGYDWQTKSALSGWRELPQGIWQVAAGESPLPGLPLVRFTPTRQEVVQTIRGERIRLEPGHAYLLSGWIRSTSNGQNAGYGVRFLDADGRELPFTQEPVGLSMNWDYTTRLFGALSSGDAEAMPVGAVFAEPFISVTGQTEWIGLFFGKVD